LLKEPANVPATSDYSHVCIQTANHMFIAKKMLGFFLGAFRQG